MILHISTFHHPWVLTRTHIFQEPSQAGIDLLPTLWIVRQLTASSATCGTSYILVHLPRWHDTQLWGLSSTEPEPEPSVVGFRKRSHNQSIPCPLHGRLIQPIPCWQHNELHPINHMIVFCAKWQVVRTIFPQYQTRWLRLVWAYYPSHLVWNDGSLNIASQLQMSVAHECCGRVHHKYNAASFTEVESDVQFRVSHRTIRKKNRRCVTPIRSEICRITG